MARKKYTCFVISSIGEIGSAIRQDADDLLEMIIRPALEIYDFNVLRGDHRSEANQIDIDVIKSVQESDLCIVDISHPNPNVYYELGRRDETGKDRILLKSRHSGDLPVDIATQRYIEFDLDSRHGVRDAVLQIRNFVEPMLERGFESNTSGASLSDIAAAVSRIERKLDRIGTTSTEVITPAPAKLDGDPREVFTLAFRQNNLPLMDQALDHLVHSTERMKFLDYYAELAAGRGSVKAGQMLIDGAEEFFDSRMSFKKKVEYLGSLVGFLNRTEQEHAHLDLVERLCARLWSLRNEAESPLDIALIHNQRNRLYHGIFFSTRDIEWCYKAINELERAKEYAPGEAYIYFNLSIVYRSIDEYVSAKENILHALKLDGEKQDADHLEVACKILRKLDDPEYPTMLERLRAVSPIKAALLESSRD